MARRHLMSAVLVMSLLLTMGLATGALAGNVDPPSASKDHLQPNLTLYSVETNSAFLDNCPFVAEDETPEERDQRCKEEAEAFDEGEDGEGEPSPLSGVLDAFAIDEELYFDEAREQPAGINKVVCTGHFGFTVLCEGVVVLHDGNLFWSTYVDFSQLEGEEGDPVPDEGLLFATVAIHGGTGAYVGAEGYADLFETSQPDAEETLSRYEIYVIG